MDPVTILIIALLALGGGGSAGGAAIYLRRRMLHARLRQAMVERRPHDGKQRSLLDVFWDLGVSEFALEIMASQGLLAESADEVDLAHLRLDELLETHGGWDAFIDETLEVIGEFYAEHKEAGDRRRLPTLSMRVRKLLPTGEPAAEPLGSGVSTGELVPYQPPGDLAAVDADGSGHGLPGRHAALAERGPALAVAEAPLADSRGQAQIDIDRVGDLGPLDLLGGLFEGRFTTRLQQWWDTRRLRSRKSELDAALIDFYELYRDCATADPSFYDMVYDTARRWRDEALRIGRMADRRRWAGEGWAPAADVLVAEARRFANHLEQRARRNIDQTIESIHQSASRGDAAMAGYLVYLNRHAFFAGRASGYDKLERRVEQAIYHVQEELRALKREGKIE